MKGKGQRVRVAGTMSGTSMDGVDVAVIETDGIALLAIGETRFRPYDATERAVLRAALGTWPGAPEAEAAARVVEAAHLEALRGIGPVDLVALHGQTLAHDPDAARTHQCGDGARLAEALGQPVVWDFRSADMMLGGQGAPLAPFYHWAMARWAGLSDPVAVLNLGGVGNITWLDPAAPSPDAPGALLAFDTGPANAPLDDLMAARGLGPFDRDGALAQRGQVAAPVVEAFLADRYFWRIPPKSLDRGAFAALLPAVADLSDADALATLVACVAGAVARGMEHLPSRPDRILVTGGGRHNAAMMAALEGIHDGGGGVVPVEEIGLDGDALEAQAFAYLGARVRAGLTTSAPGTTGVAAAVGGGTLSTP